MKLFVHFLTFLLFFQHPLTIAMEAPTNTDETRNVECSKIQEEYWEISKKQGKIMGKNSKLNQLVVELDQNPYVKQGDIQAVHELANIAKQKDIAWNNIARQMKNSLYEEFESCKDKRRDSDIMTSFQGLPTLILTNRDENAAVKKIITAISDYCTIEENEKNKKWINDLIQKYKEKLYLTFEEMKDANNNLQKKSALITANLLDKKEKKKSKTIARSATLVNMKTQNFGNIRECLSKSTDGQINSPNSNNLLNQCSLIDNDNAQKLGKFISNEKSMNTLISCAFNEAINYEDDFEKCILTLLSQLCNRSSSLKEHEENIVNKVNNKIQDIYNKHQNNPAVKNSILLILDNYPVFKKNNASCFSWMNTIEQDVFVDL